MNITSIIGALITVGGLGFINYSISDQLGTYEQHGDKRTSQIATCLGWSIFDYALYLLAGHFLTLVPGLKGNLLIVSTMMATMAISFITTILIAKPLQSFVYWCYGHVLNINNDAVTNIGSVWDNVFKQNERIMAYCYDFSHTPLGAGCVKFNSINSSNRALLLDPFVDQKREPQPSYEDMERMSQNPENHTNMMINELVDYDKQMIIFVVKYL